MEEKEAWPGDSFPRYSLSPDFDADDRLAATLKECYAPEAARLRTMFLVRAYNLTHDLAEQRDQQCPVSIADDLIARAGGAFEAHLRNYGSSDLERFDSINLSYHALPRLIMFFQRRESFTPQAWETMRFLLSTVWDWARHWRLNHYTYVHFACLALIEWHSLSFLDPLTTPVPQTIVANIWLPYLDSDNPLQTEDVTLKHLPYIGWCLAANAFYLPASRALDESIPQPPKGFPLYRGATTYEGATDRKIAQQNYVQLCQRQVIEASLLADLEGCRPDVIAETRRVAKKYCEEVDRHYEKAKKTPPASYWLAYGRDIELTTRRVVLKQDWPLVAKDIRDRHEKLGNAQDRAEKAVRKTIGRLFLPNKSAFFGKRCPQKSGNLEG